MRYGTLAGGLFQGILCRQFAEGRRLIEETADALTSLSCEERGTARLFFALCCWAEYSPAAATAARRLAAGYRRQAWPGMSLGDWGWVEAGMARLGYLE